MDVEPLEPLLRMLLAAALVLPIGLERELRGKAAGLRTHVVVGTASAALGYVSLLAASVGAADQTRIAAQVVSGVGFMGAGVIFAAGGRVHGLTTAAALWGASAVGLCVGLGAPWLAVALVLVTVLFLGPVDWLSDRALVPYKHEERSYTVLVDDVTGLARMQRVVAAVGVRAVHLALSEFDGGINVRLVVRGTAKQAEHVITELRALDAVSFVTDETLSDVDE
jgi:uncharacterized membrane protein YhiD involved in acid resistance